MLFNFFVYIFLCRASSLLYDNLVQLRGKRQTVHACHIIPSSSNCLCHHITYLVSCVRPFASLKMPSLIIRMNKFIFLNNATLWRASLNFLLMRFTVPLSILSNRNQTAANRKRKNMQNFHRRSKNIIIVNRNRVENAPLTYNSNIDLTISFLFMPNEWFYYFINKKTWKKIIPDRNGKYPKKNTNKCRLFLIFKCLSFVSNANEMSKWNMPICG